MSDSNQLNVGQSPAEREKLQQVRDKFGVAAADYVTSKVHASGRDLAWLVEAAELTGTERALDIATGGGHTAFALAPYVAEVVALDLTRPMLEAAQKEANVRQLQNISFLEGDAHFIPSEDAGFDIVSCRFAAHHFPNVRQAVSEWARVLKPGGKMLLVDTISPEESDVDEFLNTIEILRDPSHVRNQRLSEWKTFLSDVGLVVRQVREWGVFLDVPSWTQRIRTPAEQVVVIEERMHNASSTARALLTIEEKDDGVLTFSLPTVLLVSVKSKETA